LNQAAHVLFYYTMTGGLVMFGMLPAQSWDIPHIFAMMPRLSLPCANYWNEF
jgi:hypothetical protein